MRSFGIASSTVPARVSHSRRRYPDRREFTRSVVTSPYPALQRTSTSASIIRWANSRIISRSTSGLADARVSSNCAPGTGTMTTPATSLSFVSTSHFEGSRGGRLPSRRHAAPGKTVTSVPVTPYTTSVDVNKLSRALPTRRAR